MPPQCSGCGSTFDSLNYIGDFGTFGDLPSGSECDVGFVEDENVYYAKCSGLWVDIGNPGGFKRLLRKKDGDCGCGD